MFLCNEVNFFVMTELFSMSTNVGIKLMLDVFYRGNDKGLILLRLLQEPLTLLWNKPSS